MSEVRMPDAQHVMLDALLSEVDRLTDLDVIDADEAQYLHENEPESHVFMGEDTWDLDPDPEECMSIIREVGSRDLDEKIRYWTRALENIRDAQAEGVEV